MRVPRPIIMACDLLHLSNSIADICHSLIDQLQNETDEHITLFLNETDCLKEEKYDRKKLTDLKPDLKRLVDNSEEFITFAEARFDETSFGDMQESMYFICQMLERFNKTLMKDLECINAQVPLFKQQFFMYYEHLVDNYLRSKKKFLAKKESKSSDISKVVEAFKGA